MGSESDGDGGDERRRRSGARPVAVRDWPPGAGPKKRIAPGAPPSVPATTRNCTSCSVSGRGDVDVVVNAVDLKAAGVQVNQCALSRQDSAGADCIDHARSPRKSPRFKEGSKLLVVEPLQVVDAAARTPTAKREGMATRTTPARKRKEAIQAESAAAATSTPKKNVERMPKSSKENVEADREAVRAALRTYDALRRMFAREQKSPGIAKRPDLKAATLMRDKRLWINNNKGAKHIGAVPGVEVGDHFWFRIELCLVGLHRQIQAGIDCTVSFGQQHGGVSLATSICASGGYENAFEDGETLIYTGQGGINRGDKKQREDQKLERGNLALSNSQEKKNLVRVIRGLKDKTSPSGTTYIYDGLYMVVSSWVEKGAAGYGVYKFKLQRQPGQAESETEMIKFLSLQKEADTSSSSAPPPPPPREGLLLGDLSGGREPVPVCLVNQLDSSVVPEFEYVTRVVYPAWLAGGSEGSEGCCGCSDGCKGCCACLARNRPPELAYTKNGSLVEARSVIYECGSQCECCYNRVVSQGKLRYRLEVFKTKNKGWGVRSWDLIPCGSFVCEYVGEVIDGQEAERRESDEYLFDLDRVELLKGGDAAEISEGGGGLWLDASRCGNVARFINHSCSPNLFVQPVVYGHHGDVRVPHIGLFAMENILPMKEITYDYGHRKGKDDSGDGETTQECHCGSSYCKGGYIEWS